MDNDAYELAHSDPNALLTMVKIWKRKSNCSNQRRIKWILRWFDKLGQTSKKKYTGSEPLQKQVSNLAETVFHESSLEKNQNVCLAKMIDTFGNDSKKYSLTSGNQLQGYFWGLIQLELNKMTMFLAEWTIASPQNGHINVGRKLCTFLNIMGMRV